MKRSQEKILAAFSAGSLVLSACGARVVSGEPAPAYNPSEVSYGLGERDTRVTVFGTLGGMEPAAFARLVTDSMQGNIAGVPTNFTTTPGDSARPDYWVAIAFAARGNIMNTELCGPGPIQTGEPTDGQLMVQGAFCRSGGALTQATGYADWPMDPQSPAFRDFVHDVAFALFPRGEQEPICASSC